MKKVEKYFSLLPGYSYNKLRECFQQKRLPGSHQPLVYTRLAVCLRRGWQEISAAHSRLTANSSRLAADILRMSSRHAADILLMCCEFTANVVVNEIKSGRPEVGKVGKKCIVTQSNTEEYFTEALAFEMERHGDEVGEDRKKCRVWDLGIRTSAALALSPNQYPRFVNCILCHLSISAVPGVITWHHANETE